jgi:hypothetical protein
MQSKKHRVAGGPKPARWWRLADHFIARINYEIKHFLQALPFSAIILLRNFGSLAIL